MIVRPRSKKAQPKTASVVAEEAMLVTCSCERKVRLMIEFI